MEQTSEQRAQSAERKAVAWIYIRTGVLSALTALLCLVGGIYTRNWRTTVLAAIPVLWGIYNFLSLRHCLQNGKIASVYAVCDGPTGKKNFGFVDGKGGRYTTYRFLAASEESGAADETHCFFLSADDRKFREGETYCFLFYKRANGKLDNNNLISRAVVPPDILCFDAGEPNEDEAAAPGPNNAIVFHPAGTGKDGDSL